MKLSIIIPVYNEEKTIISTLAKVAKVKISKVTKEIIVVNDGSSDNTKMLLQKKLPVKCKVYHHEVNKGKGAAIQTALNSATGEYCIIQDADLEYDPGQIELLVTPLLLRKAQVVYGTRLKRWPNFHTDETTPLFFLHYVGNRMLSFVASVLYGQWITDMETGYKLLSVKVAKTLALVSNGFEIEAEITVKLMKKRYFIYEVPIKTSPRGYAEGKKLHTLRDGIKALFTLVKYRFTD